MDRIIAPTEYKGLKIVVKRNTGSKTINARYIGWNKSIILYNNWFNHNKLKREGIVEHEYGHFVFNKIPVLYTTLWKLISNGKVITILNILGFTEYIENAYVGKYAEKSYKEDFCECIKMQFIFDKQNKQLKYNTFADDKIKIAMNLYNKFQ